MGKGIKIRAVDGVDMNAYSDALRKMPVLAFETQPDYTHMPAVI